MTSIRPRFLPRDALDILFLLFVCIPLQVLPLFGLPFLVGYLTTGSPVIGFLSFVLMYVLFVLFSVWALRVTQNGVEFRRLLGSPKLLAWKDISSIRIAKRMEVVRYGWLWPLFPAREMTACLSARDHVRFEGSFGFCFFPPKDTKAFLHLADKYRKGALAAEGLQFPATQPLAQDTTT